MSRMVYDIESDPCHFRTNKSSAYNRMQIDRWMHEQDGWTANEKQ